MFESQRWRSALLKQWKEFEKIDFFLGMQFESGMEKRLWKVQSRFYPGDLMTRTGDREIRSVSGRLPDNPGELARIWMSKTKTADRIKGMLWLVTQSPNIICYSPPSNSCGICTQTYCNRCRNKLVKFMLLCYIIDLMVLVPVLKQQQQHYYSHRCR